ncbi:hypothetical protein [Klebsiella michiganensis]
MALRARRTRNSPFNTLDGETANKSRETPPQNAAAKAINAGDT